MNTREEQWNHLKRPTGKAGLSRRSFWSPSAFTLIELLIVIAIIAVLLSILVPALQKAKEHAKRVACVAHLNACGKAFVDYSMENKGKSPRCSTDVSMGTGSYALWLRPRSDDRYKGFVGHGILGNTGYITNPEIFYCPSNTNETLKYGMQSPSWFAQGKGGGWPDGEIPDDVPAGQIWVQSTYQYRSLFDGERPASESKPGWRAPNFDHDNEEIALMSDVYSDPERGVNYHHIEGYNVVYVDGHASFVMDHNFEIRDYNGGGTYHTAHDLQSEVWRTYFDSH